VNNIGPPIDELEAERKEREIMRNFYRFMAANQGRSSELPPWADRILRTMESEEMQKITAGWTAAREAEALGFALMYRRSWARLAARDRQVKSAANKIANLASRDRLVCDLFVEKRRTNRALSAPQFHCCLKPMRRKLLRSNGKLISLRTVERILQAAGLLR
jgi:hypothetical protein